MPVTELYAFNLTCVILLMALYGVAISIKKAKIEVENMVSERGIFEVNRKAVLIWGRNEADIVV